MSAYDRHFGWNGCILRIMGIAGLLLASGCGSDTELTDSDLQMTVVFPITGDVSQPTAFYQDEQGTVISADQCAPLDGQWTCTFPAHPTAAQYGLHFTFGDTGCAGQNAWDELSGGDDYYCVWPAQFWNSVALEGEYESVAVSLVRPSDQVAASSLTLKWDKPSPEGGEAWVKKAWVVLEEPVSGLSFGGWVEEGTLITDTTKCRLNDEQESCKLPAGVPWTVTTYLDAGQDAIKLASSWASVDDAEALIVPCTDNDSDGYCRAAAEDCDDAAGTTYPGATELCNSVDDDCNGEKDETIPTWYLDQDGDGYGVDAQSVTACEPGSSYVLAGGDCNDNKSTINPGVTEDCNEVDDDCDGDIDDGALTTYYRDVDGDGVGVETDFTEACTVPAGYAPTSGDCKELDSDIYPGAVDVCDEKDNDCDGAVDEYPYEPTSWYFDEDGDTYGNPNSSRTSCDDLTGQGYVKNHTDCNDEDNAIHPKATEVCDDVDNDCDGDTDGDAVDKPTWYHDGDGDLYGVEDVTEIGCTASAGYVADAGDCDDADADVHPGAQEVCDADQTDEDCDGAADDQDASVDPKTTAAWFADGDCDGYGNPDALNSYCDKPDTGCWVKNDDDCDDVHAEAHPDAAEVCDHLDNDCDGEIDQGLNSTWYADTDGDGFGDEDATVSDCAQPDDYVDASGDCDDTDAGVSPDSEEVCDPDDVDENCNGVADDQESPPPSNTAYFYLDADGDGYGASGAQSAQASCNPPEGYAAMEGDCNDGDLEVHPDADEACNEQDDDCDGEIDDGAETTWYADTDEDGYGDPATTTVACSQPDGYVATAGDCQDAYPSINPEGQEVCDAGDTDENCNGTSDDDDTSTASTGKVYYYQDADGDGYGNPNARSSKKTCDPADGYVADSTDCDDTDVTASPDADEVCDSVDNDCDGNIDEGVDTTSYYDEDGDGFGGEVAATACDEVLPGLVTDGSDCNDDDPQVHPMVVSAGAATGGDGSFDAPFDSIQEGIDEPDNCDKVLVQKGTYSEAVSIAGKDAGFILESTDGSDYTAIQSSGGKQALKVSASRGVEVRGFTLTAKDAVSAAGAAVYITQSQEVLLDSLVIKDSATKGSSNGGGISVTSSGYEDPVRLEHCTVTNNTALNGGALEVNSSIVELFDTTVSNNAATGSGGGAFVTNSDGSTGGSLTIDHSTFEDNVAALSGGGVYNEVESDPTSTLANYVKIEYSTFAGNDAAAAGGAAYNPTWVRWSYFIQNATDTTLGSGGALALLDDPEVADNEVINSAFMNNIASMGGSIYVKEAPQSEMSLKIAQNVFADDIAYWGDGVSVYIGVGCAPRFYNNIIVNETMQDRAEELLTQEDKTTSYVYLYDATAEVEYNDVHYTGLGRPFSAYTKEGEDGNINVDPAFCSYQTADYDNVDFHLLGGTLNLLVNANPNDTDPDGSASDMGVYGGSEADEGGGLAVLGTTDSCE